MTNIYKKFIDNKKSELPYIKLNFGESFTGKFKGATPKKNRWGKDVLSYAFLDDEGRRKEWDNGSPFIAESFSQIAEGTTVTLSCTTSDRLDPEGNPYKNYQIFVDGKEVTAEPTVEQD